MFGPHITVNFERRDRGEGPIAIELGPPADEQKTVTLFSEWFCNNRTRLYMGRACPMCENTEREWLENQACDEHSMLWCIFADDLLIGSVGLGEIDYRHSRGRYGCMIGRREHWDRGIGTAAGIAVIEWAFNNIIAGGLNKIHTEVLTENVRNMRASQKVGFREIGITRQQYWFQGRWFDAWFGEVLSNYWQQERVQIFQKAGITELNLYPQTEVEGFEPIRLQHQEEDSS